MSYPNIIDDIQEIQKYLLDWMYPVGSIYMSVNNKTPQSIFGGTWEQIKDTFLLCSGSTYSAGSTGGEATHKLTQAETPAHTHTRGNMNITGAISWVASGYGASNSRTTGCFSGSGFYNNESGYQKSSAAGQGTLISNVTFTAANTWTGSTSSVGGNASHNNMPPYLAVYVWKRTA